MGALYFGGCLDSSFFLLDRVSDQGASLKFSLTIVVLIGYLLRICINTLPSHSLLLSLKIILDNTLFRILPSNVESLGTITSRKYDRVYVYLGDVMASLKLH